MSLRITSFVFSPFYSFCFVFSVTLISIIWINILLPTCPQVKEGGKGVKTAYKDLKSKLKSNNSSTLGRSEFHAEENNNHTSFVKPHRRSAPNSPVLARPNNNASSSPYSPQQSTQSMMQASSSSSSTLPVGGSSSYSYAVSTSPGSGTGTGGQGASSFSSQPLSGSTSSSSSLSEINMQLWQEMQVQHRDLFVSPSPPVDRTVSWENWDAILKGFGFFSMDLLLHFNCPIFCFSAFQHFSLISWAPELNQS